MKKITEKESLIIYSIVFVLIPLIIGAILYYIFCPDVWFVKAIDGWILQINRPEADQLPHPFLKFIRNYGFDLVWAFAMTNALFIIFSNNAKPIIIFMLIPVILGIAMEILQLLGIAQGTFDLWDVLAEGSGSVLGAIIIKNYRRHFK